MSAQRRARRAVGLHVMPTSMTVLAICAGLTSIKFALDGRPHIAVVLLAVAAVLDGLDGRVARILDASSRMGKEVDSLADALSFGVAPALVVYVSLLSTFPAGWIVTLLYAICIVLRLARFNALCDDGTLPAHSREFFVGMPAPAGAGMAILPLVAKVQFGEGWWTSEWFFCLWLVACSALVVSELPMRKIPNVSVPPSLAAVLLAVLAIVVAAAFLFPYVVIMLVNVAYLCHIPFSVRSHRWQAAHPEAWADEPKQRRVARRAIRRAQPNRRSMVRLRLRRPGRTT
jgi:CDP-diacylglycerol---serine O-phosphatidyltransferase